MTVSDLELIARQILQMVHVGVTLVDAQDPSLPLIYVNTAYERMTGYSEQELLGRNPRFLQGKDRDQAALEKVRTCIRDEADCEVVIRNYRKDGQMFWNELKISPIYDPSGQLKYFVGIQSDVTQRKQLRETLEQTLEQEQHLNAFRSQIISLITHEFRTPLAIVQNSVEVLTKFADTVTEADRSKFIELANSSFSRLQRLVEDIAFVHDLHTHEFPYYLPRVNVAQLCRLEAITTNLTTNYSHQIDIKILDEYAIVQADAELLRRSLKNLLTNAVNYSPPGSKIEIELKRQNSHLHLNIRDHGHGIASHEQTHIFEEFYRGENAISVSGAGLGLSIAKRCIERCGGQITFDSDPGIGSRFSVILPVAMQLHDQSASY